MLTHKSRFTVISGSLLSVLRPLCALVFMCHFLLAKRGSLFKAPVLWANSEALVWWSRWSGDDLYFNPPFKDYLYVEATLNAVSELVVV